MNQFSINSLVNALRRGLSVFRPACRALLTPQAVVLEPGDKSAPLVRRLDATGLPLELQFTQAMAVLLQMLDQAGVQGQRLHLLVSDDWTRPALLALPNPSASETAVETLLARHYRGVYGDLMDAWQWCWDLQGIQLVAVAWPKVGLDALRAGLAVRFCTLASARSLGLALASQLSVKSDVCWVLVNAPTSATLLRLQGSALQHWCVLAHPIGDVQSMPVQLAREALRRSDSCRSVVIIDCNASNTSALLLQNLLVAGWVARVCADSTFANMWGWRLQQLGQPAAPA